MTVLLAGHIIVPSILVLDHAIEPALSGVLDLGDGDPFADPRATAASQCRGARYLMVDERTRLRTVA